MSELKDYDIMDIEAMDDERLEKSESGKIQATRVYIKSEADRVIAELQEKLKVQTSIAEEGWKEFRTYHTSYAEAVKELYDKNKELRHQKYKRCLDKAEMCKARYDEEDEKVNWCELSWEYISKEMKYWERWRQRWLELADKFNEA